MRLIDADDLVVRMNYKHYKMTHEYEHNYEYGDGYYDGACEVIDAPTVEDAVVVVRCKDCVHWNNGDCYRIELTRATDFCSYGERKSGNE